MRFAWPKKSNSWMFSWHRWFAWFPVRLVCGDMAWLETVERIDLNPYGEDGIDWTYRGMRRDGVDL